MNEKNKTKEKVGIDGIIARIIVIVLMWIGVFHIFRTALNTNWSVLGDVYASFCGVCLIVFFSKKFRQWIFNDML